MSGGNDQRDSSSLDDETPGSQGEVEAGSEGDFDGPESNEEQPAEPEQDVPPTG
ncbi:MAG: hypothetical protein LC798_18250 [Chloroflexi bacterium]|nr:hypothetical protein [Chloroflexota bacterium]